MRGELKSPRQPSNPLWVEWYEMGQKLKLFTSGGAGRVATRHETAYGVARTRMPLLRAGVAG